MNNTGTLLGIAAGIFLLVAFVLPWFVAPNTYIIALVITAILFIGAWFIIVVRKRKLP